MEYHIDFKCSSNDYEEVFELSAKTSNISLKKAYSNSLEMSMLAEHIKIYNNDSVVSLPFCLTIEAEALGADIKPPKDNIGPRVGQYAFRNVEDLKNIKLIDLTKNRIYQVLKAVEILTSKGELVILNVQGPFTIMSCLMDPVLFYKSAIKYKTIVENFMNVICESIITYIIEGLKRGARIISFGDSSGDIDILGPKIYREYSGRYTYNILKKVNEKIEDSIIHLCGKTSNSLKKSGFIRAFPVKVDSNITYGEILKKLVEEKNIKIIGFNCLRNTHLQMFNSSVWGINLV